MIRFLLLFFFSLGCIIPASAQQKYKLVELPDKAYASCFVYELQDNRGNHVVVPDEVNKNFDCPVLLDIVADHYLVYADSNSIRQYDIDTRETKIMLTYPQGVDGFSARPELSPDGKKMLIGLIDSDGNLNYGAMVNIIILYLDNQMNVIQQKEFYKNVQYNCGNVCMIEAGNLLFKNNDAIQYRIHELSDDPKAGEWEIITITN